MRTKNRFRRKKLKKGKAKEDQTGVKMGSSKLLGRGVSLAG